MAEVCLGTLQPSDFYDIFKEEKPLVEEDASKQGGKEDAAGNSQSESQLTAEQKLHFQTVFAHRYYQFAMCLYKIWRYDNGGDLIEQASN